MIDVTNLPESWLAYPHDAWWALLGVAADLGHLPGQAYGDDGLMQVRCRVCLAALALPARLMGPLTDRSLVTQVCDKALVCTPRLSKPL